jgi:DNA-binding XRE family transcriptional regulator
VGGSPVPIIWTTNAHGKTFIYEHAWKELRWLLHSAEDKGFSQSDIAKFVGVSRGSLRYWKSGCIKPKLYSVDEFELTRENLYWLGLCFSDGHLRRNGSENAYTWQVGSSNPFQGYWYPQFAQKHLGILRHKNRVSKTYVKFSDTYSTWAFYTNVSGISPIFGKFLERKGVILPRKTSPITGFKKFIPKELSMIKGFEALFQGIFDGDGFYSIKNNGIQIGLSFDYTQNNARGVIEIFPLTPTLLRNSVGKTFAYREYGGDDIAEVRFAPSSLSKLREESAENVVNQLEFMVAAANHSIRPDKVHNLVLIIERLASAKYGEYHHRLGIQKEIRNEIRRKSLLEKTEELKKRYPKKRWILQTIPAEVG